MRLDGHTFDEPNKEYCVLPRTGKADIVFIATPVLDFDEFERLCPEPTPPSVIKPGKTREYNHKDPTYLQATVQRAERRVDWIVIQSLRATPGLEWGTVKWDDPKTWGNYKDELKKAFFSHTEIQRIQNAAFIANSLNESRVQEARENFLHGLAEAASDTSSLHTEQASTPSGEPANGSV